MLNDSHTDVFSCRTKCFGLLDVPVVDFEEIDMYLQFFH
jgi:hypothetical protein